MFGIESIGIVLSRERITKALIRLRGCAGCSASLLFAHSIRQVFLLRGSDGPCHEKRDLNVLRFEILQMCMCSHSEKREMWPFV